MPQQFGDLCVGNAVGKCVGCEAVPVAVGDGFQSCLLAQTSQPPADGLSRQPLSVLTRKQKPLRVLGDLLTQDAHGFWTEEDDTVLAQMSRLVFVFQDDLLAQVNVLRSQSSNLAWSCSCQPEQLQERPERARCVIAQSLWVNLNSAWRKSFIENELRPLTSGMIVFSTNLLSNYPVATASSR